MSDIGSVQILGTQQASEWEALLDRLPRTDLTFHPRFARIYEEKGEGQAECFIYRRGSQFVLYPYIRRFLGENPAFGESFRSYSDVVTPYCYGGFLHNAPDEVEARALIQAFRQAFDRHALETRIVTEFIRFHPVLATQIHSDPNLEVTLHRQNVILSLPQDEEGLLRGCRKSFRNCVRHGRRAGLELSFDQSPEAFKTFTRLYQSTMQRHHQFGYLNLKEDYFQALCSHIGEDCLLARVILNGGVCAMGLFLRHGDYLDYFLSASDNSMLSHFPNHFMLFEVASWCSRNGIRTFHLGGGADSLYFFKRGLSSTCIPYYLGRRTHHSEVSAHLVRHRFPGLYDQGSGYISFFPPYRFGLE